MIGRIAALAIIGFSVLLSIYKAGKYANGGKDVNEGTIAAVASVGGAIINGLIFLGLYFDW